MDALIPILYENTEQDFTSVGLGFLPSWIDGTIEVVEERNGEFYLQGELPINGVNVGELFVERIIMAAPAPGKPMQPFRIRRISKSDDRETVSVLAQHISYQLTESVIVTYGADAANLPTYASAQAALDYLAQVGEPNLSDVFTFASDIVPESSVAFGIRGDPVSFRAALGGVEGSMIDTFGGELEWDRWDVNLLSSRGRNTDKVIRYGQNLESLDFETDVSGLVTGYVGYVRLDGGSVVTGDTVLASNAYDYAYPRVVAVDLTEKFEGAEYVPATSQIVEETEAYVATQQLHRLSTSITITAVPDHLQDVYLCDTVTVIHPAYNIQDTAKIVKTVYDPIREKYKSITIGTIKKDVLDTIAKLLR